jgi:hypothetical protein
LPIDAMTISRLSPVGACGLSDRFFGLAFFAASVIALRGASLSTGERLQKSQSLFLSAAEPF